MFNKENWRHFDYWLFGAVVILSIFGIAMIRSAIAGNFDLATIDKSQTQFVVVGLVIILVVAMIDYRYWSSLASLLYVFGVIFLIIILLIGNIAFGSTRWIVIAGINIQPSELVKIIMIIVLADFFARNKDRIHDFRTIARSFVLTAGVVVLIYLQPNLSTSIVIFVIWAAMLWLSGLPVKYIALFVAGGVILALVLFPFVETYQQQRVLNFIFPNPNASYGDNYNVEQALITIGSGGWFGMGYGHGTQVQLRFLKVRHTDFIFASMAEEFGFVGTVLVVSVLLFVILRCIRVARHADDPFGALIAYGFATLLFFQTSVNIGVNLNVIPVTGLTLPFVSYGGSSLISLVLGIGLVESVAAHSKNQEF
ncbi:MAG TPA: FtsW/RodA/SpoVE family cell cycle protein [Longilinea sp.]|nr:FtsW/RodA/SpoVE family cell cycle protein [Longilinea sp.]